MSAEQFRMTDKRSHLIGEGAVKQRHAQKADIFPAQFPLMVDQGATEHHAQTAWTEAILYPILERPAVGIIDETA